VSSIPKHLAAFDWYEPHLLWLAGDPAGQQASLDGANLDGANLYRANLYRANLNRANLDGANLDGANLNRANLDGTQGIVQLDMFDPRGYVAFAQLVDGAWIIRSGCRQFTVGEALAHWGAEDYEGDYGHRYVRAINDFKEEHDLE